jgi:transcriptional regulator with XRE-family HTH domain
MPTGSSSAEPAHASDASRLIGERIRAERLRVGITQMDLANLAGLNVANFGRIERGVGNPNIDTLIRIAGVLGVDAADFVRGITVDQLGAAQPRYTAADFLRAQAEQRR